MLTSLEASLAMALEVGVDLPVDLAVVLALILLRIARELSAASPSEAGRRFARLINVAAAPLSFIFLLIMVERALATL